MSSLAPSIQGPTLSLLSSKTPFQLPLSPHLLPTAPVGQITPRLPTDWTQPGWEGDEGTNSRGRAGEGNRGRQHTEYQTSEYIYLDGLLGFQVQMLYWRRLFEFDDCKASLGSIKMNLFFSMGLVHKKALVIRAGVSHGWHSPELGCGINDGTVRGN